MPWYHDTLPVGGVTPWAHPGIERHANVAQRFTVLVGHTTSMSTEDDIEACGRCAMSSVVDTTVDGDAEDPFAGARIELSDAELRSASRHVVALGRVKERLNEWATRLTYGRS